MVDNGSIDIAEKIFMFYSSTPPPHISDSHDNYESIRKMKFWGKKIIFH